MVDEFKLLHMKTSRDFKQKTTHRRADLQRFGEKQRAEADMIRRFIKKVGGPKDTIIICFGDGS